MPGTYRAYGISESDDLIHWSSPRMMFYRDALDPPKMQFYAHTTFHYESMWFGLIKTMLITEPEGASGHWKHCELQLSQSRDGRHYTRCRDRTPFLPVPTRLDALDMDYPSVASGVPIRMGNELWFYYADRRHWNRPGTERDSIDMRLFLATLRVDGFASLNGGDEAGQVVTHPLTYAGRSLFVNADVERGGYVKCALRSVWGETLASYTHEECQEVSGDVHAARIIWAEKEALPSTAKASVRLVFELKKAKLYSF